MCNNPEQEDLIFEELDELYFDGVLFHKGFDLTKGYYWYAYNGYDQKIVITRKEMRNRLLQTKVVGSKNGTPIFKLVADTD